MAASPEGEMSKEAKGEMSREEKGEMSRDETDGAAQPDTQKALDGSARRRRYERVQGGPAPALTAQKLALLRFVAELRLLSMPQLARLTGLSERSARRHLRELFDAGLVDRVPVPRAALAPAAEGNDARLLYGSAPTVYVSVKAGVALLVKAGYLPPDAQRLPLPEYGPRNSVFLAHELAVRDARVWLECDAAKHAGRGVLRWSDGREATIPLPDAGVARPDAWFVYRLGRLPPVAEVPDRPLVLVGLVETDRGTERGGARWGSKFEDYRRLLLDRAALAAATGYVNARVLVLTPDAQRRDALAGLLAERARETGAAAALLGRFWLAERSILEGAELTEPAWRRPGSDGLWPLVTAGTLALRPVIG